MPALRLFPLHAPPARRLAPAAMAAAALVALAAPRPAAVQPARRPAAEARNAAPADGAGMGELPRPFWLALLALVLSGVAGAAAAERLARPRARHPAAALENLVAGSIGAVALLGVNPPGHAWPALAGTAAAGGIAARALLVASDNAHRALTAELARDTADEGVRRVAVLAAEQMETLRRLAVEGSGLIGSGTAPEGAWERSLDVYAGRARVELMRLARRESAPVRSGADGVASVHEREGAR